MWLFWIDAKIEFPCLRAQARPASPIVGADGVERTQHRRGTRTLETLLGTLQVARDGHGGRGRETLFPLDAALNLPPERYSFGIRRRAAEEVAKGAFDELVNVLATQSGAAIAKRQVEEVVRRTAQDFDSFYQAATTRHLVRLTIVVDLIHVLEYLWKAAYVFYPEGSPEAETWVTERLLCGEAAQVIASIRRTATHRGLRASERKPADTCAAYIERHKAYLDCDAYLKARLPIATGVIESACRYLLRDRVCRREPHPNHCRQSINQVAPS